MKAKAKAKAKKAKKPRHKWANYDTECLFGWVTGSGYYKGEQVGKEVWEHMLESMMASEENWLWTFDQEYELFLDVVLAPWKRQLAEDGDPLGALAERLITIGMANVDTLNLAVGLLKHSGKWQAYLGIMECTGDEIENDPDAFVRSTPAERGRLKAYLAETAR